MVSLNDVREAQARLQGVAVRTPLMEFLNPAVADSRKLFLKLENLQPIGAFKIRGAYNKIALLSPAEREAGVITYSSGNHGQGVAYAARALGNKAVIVMPRTAPAVKRDAVAALGAEIVLVGPSSLERQHRAEELDENMGMQSFRLSMMKESLPGREPSASRFWRICR